MSDRNNYRILVVEDEPEVARAVCDALSADGSVVVPAANLSTARRILETHTFDLAVLDLNLPDGSGLELAEPLRAVCRDLPILVLTARSGVADRVQGLRSGADDYVCKPFSPDELRARVEALLRRARSARTHVVSYADLELDLLTRRLHRTGTEAVLSAREAELLAYFLQHPEQAVPRERLLSAVWRDEAEDDSNVVSVYVNYLRNRMEQGGGSRLLHTVRGIGYMLSRKEPEEMDNADLA